MTGTNPKVALLWASFSTFVSGATTSAPLLLLFAWMSALAAAVYGTYALAGENGRDLPAGVETIRADRHVYLGALRCRRHTMSRR